MNNLPSNSGHSRGRGRGNKRKEVLQQAPILGQGNSVQGQSRSTVAEGGRDVENPATSASHVPLEGAQGDHRGSVRGRRVITEVVNSRPAQLATKSGFTGTRITVVTNYFKLEKRPDWTIHQYRVDYTPDVDSTFVRRGLLGAHGEMFGGYIFDGTMMFCTTYFNQIPNSPYVLDLVTKNKAGENVQIHIKHVGQVESSDSQQIQVLNLILRRAMEGMKLQPITRNYFDAQNKINIDTFKIDLWPGYSTSIRQHEQDILLCSEISHKVMRTDTLHTILRRAVQDYDNFQQRVQSEVKGTIVLTDYNNKTYRIDDVDFNQSPLSTFETKSGPISIRDYYKKRYNIVIRDIKQPLLVSRPTEKNIRGGEDKLILLVPELARPTGLTDAMRSNVRLMRAMSEYTRLAPDRRIERLRGFSRRLRDSKDSVELMKSWNVQLNPSLVEIPARVLPPEKIYFGNNQQYTCDERANWGQVVSRKPMFRTVDMGRWCVITPRNSVRETQDFVKLCLQVARDMRMNIANPIFDEIPDDSLRNYVQAIAKITAKDPQLVMIVMRAQNEEKYGGIKKCTCVDRPVPSQVVTLRTIAPRPERSAGLRSIAANVVIQMNAKLMGAPWMIGLPIKGLMTVGFDVCHSSKMSNKSYGALVATMDIKESARYFSSVAEHMKGQELSNQMELFMTSALRAYRDNHGALPERIAFYRDGVGDGQLSQVFNTEVKFLKNQLDKIYKSAGKESGCRLAFIVVSKRINTRYFFKTRNPDPGTVVDDVITLPERYDFFLVSQSVKQGTVSPTSYNIIHDSLGLDADKVQMLTYKMTHLYYNWSGSCRVPAVCQYAHKLAFLIAESIHRAPAAGLQNQLYFL